MLSTNLNKYLYKELAKDLEGNNEQKQVYNSTGNCVVLAGPGSGKSKILTLKLAKILNEDIEPPQGIACLTYNNECARELKEKLKKLGINESTSFFVGTVHSFCLNYIINPYKHLIHNSDLPLHIKVASYKEIDMVKKSSFRKVFKDDKYSFYFSMSFDVYRRTYVERETDEWKNNDPDIAKWIIDYEEALHKKGLIDYDDMVLQGLKMIKENRWIRDLLLAKFPVLAIDEYQDLGTSLDKIVRILCLENGIRLLAVGDPDQSIYGFTGANPSLLQDLANNKDVLKVRLKKNYRSKKEIVKASQVTLSQKRNFISNRDGEGVIKFYKKKDGLEAQCEHVCRTIIPNILKSNPNALLGDIGVLYIDKNDGDKIAREASKCKINFIRVDGNAPYNKNQLTLWVESCAGWCSGGWLKGDPSYSEIERRYVSFFLDTKISSKKLDEKKLCLFKFLDDFKDSDENLNSWLTEFENRIISKLENCFHEDETIYKEFLKMKKSSEEGQLKSSKISSLSNNNTTKSHLNLFTLHSSKGLEFKYVIMIGLEQGRLPSWGNKDKKSIEEARRLFYVGITRAKDEIHLLYSGFYKTPDGRKFYKGISPFVLELINYLKKDIR